MQLLEERIRRDGIVREGNVLKVDSFLNHQIDVELLNEIGKEFLRLFGDEGVNKILTIEASGIGIACVAAQYFKVPVVFAKKAASKNISGDTYTSCVHSFTKDKYYDIMVSKDFLGEGDRVLVIDDFLAKGAALLGLTDIIKQSGAELVGAGIVIEKAFQDGGKKIRDMGIRVESLARVASMSPEGGVVFA
ncbi:MAG: xanthine phosphoribosyltransferase [Oscillospiraceae bacterium]|nr:xanthine phosphoribosyltransferase [Oscillospiraceae bacterium]